MFLEVSSIFTSSDRESSRQSRVLPQLNITSESSGLLLQIFFKSCKVLDLRDKGPILTYYDCCPRFCFDGDSIRVQSSSLPFSSLVHDSNLNMCSIEIEEKESGWCLTRGLDGKSSSLPYCSNTTRGYFGCAPMELEEEWEWSAHRSTPSFSLSLDRFSSPIAAIQLEVAAQIKIEKERRMAFT